MVIQLVMRMSPLKLLKFISDKGFFIAIIIMYRVILLLCDCPPMQSLFAVSFMLCPACFSSVVCVMCPCYVVLIIIIIIIFSFIMVIHSHVIFL